MDERHKILRRLDYVRKVIDVYEQDIEYVTIPKDLTMFERLVYDKWQYQEEERYLKSKLF